MEALKFFHSGIRAQIRNARSWVYLGWMDFIVPYRRTFVGPLWEIISAVIWVAGLSIVFYTPEFSDMSSFVAYVACGIVAFGFISHILNSSPALYHGAGPVMQNIKIAPGFFILRNIVLNLLRFACQLIVALAAVVYFADFSQIIFWQFFTGLFLLIFTSVWVSIVLSSIGARFPDVVPIISAITRALLFVTPIFWVAGNSSLRNYISTYNPVTYFIEIMRAPLLGEPISQEAWMVVLGLNVILIPLSLYIYRFTRYRILNWI
jgi:ABC-type polysaccharide/polyol phosphate export permease